MGDTDFPVMSNNPGFNNAGLEIDPARRQMGLPGGYATQGQMVSAPYQEASVRAAEKINPDNASSQEPAPIQERVNDFLIKAGVR